MDADITFGDVEEERPRVMRRPDEDRHFSVTTCGAPRPDDLRIYVDLDTMVDMETHAQTNTGVELGGVLLGGQYVDGEGRAFVVVSDCLRADHYEATKGSFKFTHETWGDIQRRLEEYPDDLRMVGWYHTHPDWGVFLSGMDLFICDNFFNKPLDLALVIDPCRDDRGWFQWTTQGRRGTLRTGGFYLTSSRFREEELQYVAQALEGKSEMPLATRSTTQSPGGYGAPVVNVVQDRSSSQWIQIAVLGSLTLQTLLVGLLAIAMLWRGSGEEQIKLQASRETLDLLAKEMGKDKGFIKDAEQAIADRETFKTALETVSKTQREHEAEVKSLETEISEGKKGEKKLEEKIQVLSTDLKTYKSRNKELADALNSKAGEETSQFHWKSPWLWTTVAVALAAVLAGVLLFRGGRPAEDYMDHPPSSPHSSSPHSSDDFKDPPPPSNT